MRKLFFALSAWCASAVTAAAQENGRYQMVALPPGEGERGYRALISDTRDGLLWQYWNGPTATGMFIEGITFLGKITPGAKLGEYTSIERSAKPTTR